MLLGVNAVRPVGGRATEREKPDSVTCFATSSLPADIGQRVGDRCAGERWYVARTQPNAESRAASHLAAQNFDIFCPRYRKTVRHARNARSILAPLFPNYLFLRLDRSRDQWRSVNGTRGVVRLIMQGEIPQPIPHGVVESLQDRMREDGAIDWTPAFKVGQAVRIADGPFTDFVGTLEHLDARRRVHVLLDLLGRSVSVALSCEALMPAA